MGFELHKTYEQRPQRVKADFTLLEEGEPPKTIGDELFQEEFILQCVVRASFWSNRVQLETKTERAKKMIYAHMFKDVLPLVHELITDAESDETYKLACRIKDMLMNGECFD